MDLPQIKQRLRSLKRLEIRLRHQALGYGEHSLIWDRFFSLKSDQAVKYPLAYLLTVDNEVYRLIADEYLAFVYSDLFDQTRFRTKEYYDKHLLIQLHLPYDADEQAIKKRFRQLAKEYHPDTGGDAKQFIELMNLYRGLIEK